MQEHDDKICFDHKMHLSMIERNGDDIQQLWAEVNAMKKWVITGMAAVLLNLFIFIGNIIYTKMEDPNSNKDKQAVVNIETKNP